jgi:hypothetical protein
MATESQILSALVAELNSLTGLHGYEYPEPDMASPAAFPLFSQETFIAWPDTHGQLKGDLMVITAWTAGVSRAGARILADYVALTGTKSIPAKLHGNKLGTLLTRGVQVLGVQKPELQTFPDGRVYLARPITIQIYV